MSDATKAKNDGGPVFPCGWTDYDSDDNAVDEGESTGMSLRDWFAGQAMQGMLANPYLAGTKDDVARHSYGFADAMIKAREE